MAKNKKHKGANSKRSFINTLKRIAIISENVYRLFDIMNSAVGLYEIIKSLLGF